MRVVEAVFASAINGHDLDSAISKVRDKLDTERNILEKTRQLASQVSNLNTKADAQVMIQEAEQRVAYLEEQFLSLTQKKNERNSSIKSTGSQNDDRLSPSTTISEKSSTNRPHSMSFSTLDLRKNTSRLSVQKISLKVHEIAYKLEVERKIRDKANSIRMIYSKDYNSGSKGKISQITDSDRILHETNDRIRLLEYSLKSYQALYVDYGDEEDDETINESMDANAMYQPAARRPISGKLQLRIHRAKNLRRAPIHTKAFRSPQQFVVVKIDGKVCGTTPIVKDSVFNYYFEIEVKKASEIELSIFERGDKDYLIGLMWIRLSEIYEDIRKKEIVADSSSGWATAEQVAKNAGSGPGHLSQSSTAPPGGQPGAAPYQQQHLSRPGTAQSMGSRPADSAPGVFGEWKVEAQGQIELWMNFIKDTTKRRVQSRLGRKAAVRKRRGPCTEMCGHHFYPLHTYSIMKCALCGDHIVNEVGQQCDDCHLFVHQACVGRVVAHCHFQQPPEETVELGHRIPHRWEQSTNIGANWCCHCGNMLPIGRRSLKCTECSLTCHAGCKEYVPNLCGLDMVKASAMMMEIKRAKGAVLPKPKLLTKRDTVAKKTDTSSNVVSAPSADAQVANIQSKLEKMSLPSDGSPARYQQQQQAQYNPYAPGSPSASSIPPRLSQGQPSGHQRANSNEFVPIKSNPVSPTQQHMQPQQRPQGMGPPADHRLSQVGGYPPNTVVQPPSYYQQQIQQAKGQYSPHLPQQPQQQQQYSPHGQPQQQYNPYGQQQQQPYQQARPPQQQQQQGYSPQLRVESIGHQQQMQQQQQQQQYGRQSMYGAVGIAPPNQHQPQAYPQYHQGGAMTASQPQQPHPEIGQDMKQQIYQAMQQPAKNQPPRKVGIDDFKFVKVLGKGNFGKVMLSEEKGTNKIYAIKVLKKGFIVENDEFESTRSEKRVLLIANKEKHPFLIGLHSCFQTSNHIFFVMEYISGGDLMMHVQKLGSFGERRAKFFACEVLLGLAYFHKAGIVYRDLKLDNIMLDSEGHVKIADYGLCKENMGYGQTTITFCGTPEFMAPEIVLEQRYGRAVDWWAFGVLIYEMILGTSPFHGEDENEIFDSILEDEILYPVRMSRDSVFICQALLEKDSSKRLGAGPNDAEDIMKHSFFAGINWDDVLNKRIPPPYVPEIRGRYDVSNFDPEFTNEKPGLTPTNTIIESHDQKEFADFDYVSPWAGIAEKWTR
ncbi:Serine/threonine kinase [Coemansia sp. RSA 1358]|nr:Serine/threonine kinase [Coemansia sp. RSA 1358]